MRKKHILSLFLLCMLLGTSMVAQAAVKPREMDYAYIQGNREYLILGEENTYSLVMSGNPEDYTYTWNLYIRPDLGELKLEHVTEKKKTKDTTFTVKVDKQAHYMVYVEIMDKDYSSVTLSTGMIWAGQKEDESNPDTIIGKAKQLAMEVEQQGFSSDYDKALWLHDWLTNNADYDESLTVHEAREVMLDGTGVCESYALAYQLLMDEIDIPVLYTTGYAGGELHAWNLIQLDDEWYHVDVTWDDPVGGGNEGYGYFGLSDDLMKRDHDWERQNYILPKAAGTEYNFLTRNGAKNFASEEEMAKVLIEAVEKGETTIHYLYTGDDKYFGAMDKVGRWLSDNRAKHLINTYAQTGSRFSGQVEVTYTQADGAHFFTDEESFDEAMAAGLTAKEPVVKVHYRGEDKYYYISTPLRNWLSANSRKYDVTEYSYSYYDTSADITVTYGDFTGYTRFNNDEELNALLAEAIINKQEVLKLYYTGEDDWYNIGNKLNNWQYESKDQVAGMEGGYKGYTADLKVTYK